MDRDRRAFFVKSGAAGLAALGASSCATHPANKPPEINPALAAKVTRRAPMARSLGDRDDIVLGQVQRPDLLARHVGLDLAIYDPATAVVHLLNPSAAAIWQHVSGDRTLTSIYDMFVVANKENQVSPEQILNDVETLLKQFKKAGLIVAAGSRPPRPSLHQAGLSTVITGRDLTRLPDEYLSPEVKTFTLGELAEIFDGRRDRPAEFLDTWLLGVLIEACCPSADCCPFA